MFYSQKSFSKKRGKYIYYHPECKECSIQRATNWIKNNPDKWKPIYEKRNKDPRHKVIHKKANEEHRRSGKYLKWQRENKDKMKLYNENRENKKHEITQREWDDCRQYFNFRCAYCGKTWEKNKKETRKDLHKDHLINDGRNDLKNCIPSCMSCNSSKGELSFNNWYKSQEFYSRERYMRIYEWIRYDVQFYIKEKKKKL